MFSPDFLSRAAASLSQDNSGNQAAEVEIRFRSYNSYVKSGLPRDIFYRLLDSFKQQVQLIPAETKDSVQSLSGQGRLAKSIRRQESLDSNGNILVTWQRKEGIIREFVKKYPLLASVNRETTLNPNQITNFNHDLIRLKTRYSVGIHGFKLDMTIVKPFRLINNEWVSQDVQYEVELEVPNLQALSYLQSIVDYLMKRIWQTNLMYTSAEYSSIVNFYNQVLSLQPGTTKTRKTIIDNKKLQSFNSRYLYNARNLKINDMVYGGIVGNKTNEYIVSYKADGERKILVIDHVGLWLIAPENDANLISRNIPTAYTGLILEGELINPEKHKGELEQPYKYIYYLYDILAKPMRSGIQFSIDVQGLPYIDRINEAQAIVNDLRDNVLDIFIGTKSYMVLSTTDDFFAKMQYMMNNLNNRPFETDGFIFTPSNMPYYERIDQKRNLSLFQRVLTKYPDICKWKPQQLMTFDLMVIYDANDNPTLWAGIRREKQSNGKVTTQKLPYIYRNAQRLENRLIQFVGSDKFAFNGQIDWKTPGREHYPDQTVVEFGWDEEKMSIVPHRVRLDKSKPNNLTFAVDNWDWAHLPILETTLTGKDTVLMRRYHNTIKRKLFMSDNENKTLLDIGSGKGGDVSKWRQGKFSKIVAVEPNQDHIIELRRRLKNEGMTDKVRIIQTGGEDTALITNNVNQFIGGKVDVISCMLSFSFFWQSKETLIGLLNTIRNNLADDGKLIFMTIDGDSVEQYFQPIFNTGRNIKDINTDVMTIRPIITNNVISQLHIDIKDSKTATDQLEWLVRLSDLSIGLSTNNWQKMYFAKADKQAFLNTHETLLSRLYTYGIYVNPEVSNPDTEILVDYKPGYDLAGLHITGNSNSDLLDVTTVSLNKYTAEEIVDKLAKYMTGDYINITNEKLQSEGITVEEASNVISQWLASGKLSFPFKRLFIGDDEVNRMFINLKEFNPSFTNQALTPYNVTMQSNLFPLQLGDSYLTFIHGPDDYVKMDLITDIFQEGPRLAAIRKDQEVSVLDSCRYTDKTGKMIKDCLTIEGELSARNLREKIYESVKECTQFKPSLVVGVIKLFKARRILDFSAGWGDRLIGSIASGVECYHGFDPNTALKAGHSEIINRFADGNDNYSITYLPFEEAVVRENYYDLVFTSPPFFDFERYTNLPGQSANNYPTLTGWITNFLLASLAKSWKALQENGYMAIHITDVVKTKVCEPMCLLAQWKLPGFKYIGVISSLGKAGRPRPIWIFQKTAQTDLQRQQQAEQDLMRYYSDIYQYAKVNLDNSERELQLMQPVQPIQSAQSERFSPVNTLPIIADDTVEKLNVDWTTDAVYRIGCIGDGSCFIHALLKAINNAYAAKQLDRVAVAKYIRRDIAYILSQSAQNIAQFAPHTVFIYDQTKTVYDNYPAFATFAEFSPEYQLINMMKLINSSNYLGNEIFELTADLFNINLYIMLANRNTLAYLDSYVKPHRTINVIISGQSNHYELIAVRKNNMLQTIFTNNDPFIDTLRNKFIPN